MMDLRVVLLSAPTSFAGIMVIGPHHAAVTHVGGAPKRVSQSTWFSKVLQSEIGLGSCVLVDTSPRRAKFGGVSRGMRSAGTPPPPHPPHPPTPAAADPRRWHPAGGPVAGAGLGMELFDHQANAISLH
jgi:hypothetical protein